MVEERTSELRNKIGEESPFYIDANGKKKDSFCWECHLENVNIGCLSCERSFHKTCVQETLDKESDWICLECLNIMNAEDMRTRSTAMKSLSRPRLSKMLMYAIQRLKTEKNIEDFLLEENGSKLLNYYSVIFKPMFIDTLEKLIKEEKFASTNAFIASARWIYHNSVIYNGICSRPTKTTKHIVKLLTDEVNQIEQCHQCYNRDNSLNSSHNTFVEVCNVPHILLWVKRKDRQYRYHPFWPAKALQHHDKLVVCRIFGTHERIHTSIEMCYLYSTDSPNKNVQTHYGEEFNKACEEANLYIKNIEDKFGSFLPAVCKTPYYPDMNKTQLQAMIPNFKFELASEINYSDTLEFPELDEIKSEPNEIKDDPDSNEINPNSNKDPKTLISTTDERPLNIVDKIIKKNKKSSNKNCKLSSKIKIKKNNKNKKTPNKKCKLSSKSKPAPKIFKISCFNLPMKIIDKTTYNKASIPPEKLEKKGKEPVIVLENILLKEKDFSKIVPKRKTQIESEQTNKDKDVARKKICENATQDQSEVIVLKSVETSDDSRCEDLLTAYENFDVSDIIAKYTDQAVNVLNERLQKDLDVCHQSCLTAVKKWTTATEDRYRRMSQKYRKIVLPTRPTKTTTTNEVNQK